jgi:hypothetical protein
MKKNSLLNDYNKLKEAINNCETYGDVLKSLGLRAAGSNYKTLKSILRFSILIQQELISQ